MPGILFIRKSLTVKLAQQIQTQFKYLILRSLRNALPFKDLIAEIVLFLSQGQELNLPERNLDAQISRLMEYLRSSRCLLILDNFESILQSGKKAGRYREGMDNDRRTTPEYGSYGISSRISRSTFIFTGAIAD
jgi:hypothetical protein